MRSQRIRKLVEGSGFRRVHELDVAYDEARRGDLIESVAAGDEALGSLVDSLAATARMVAAHDASRAEQIDALRRTAELNVEVTTSHGMPAWSQAATARRVVITEVAAVLRIPDRSAETLIEESRMLVHELHATLDGLRAGDFSYRHAKSIVEHASSLGEELRAEFEQRVLPYAADLTASKFDRKARETRERMDASTIKERHLRAVADRETFWEPARDGMGWLHLYDTAANTRAAYNRITDLALALKSPNATSPFGTDDGQAEPDERTLAQRRVDVAVDLLLNGDVPDSGYDRVRASVTLTIPVLSLLGRPSASGEIEPAILDGYGPIDIDTARDLAGGAKSWLRVLTHPVTGVVVSVDSRKRKIPTPLRNLLRLRDGTCRMVGCNRAVARCDLDHNEEWQNGGQHSHDNLGHLCPKHHDQKHHTPIRMQHLPNGDIEWTMASGRTYISAPAMRMDGHAA